MAKYIPANEPATFTVKMKGIKEGTTTAAFQVFTEDGGSQVLDDLEGTVNGNVATCEWVAKGPPEDSERRSWRIQYKVTVPSKKGDDIEKVSEELIVYNNWLDISAVHAEDESVVIKDAPYEIKIGKGPKITGTTGSTGTFQQTALPPGDIKSFKWLRWASFVDWSEEQGVVRKAKILPSKIATIIAPDAKRKNKKRTWKQYVNLTAAEDAPEKGMTLTVKVKLEEGVVGDKVYLKTEWDTGTKRNDVTRAVQGGSTQEWCPEGGHEVALAAPALVAEFKVDLGYEGGSVCTISVGGNTNCEDDVLVVTNWRKLFYQVTHPGDLKAPSIKRMQSALAAVFIEYDSYKTLKVKESTTSDAPAGSWFPASDLGGKKGRKYLNVGDSNKDYWHGKFADDKTPWGVHVMCCHTQFDTEDADCEQTVKNNTAITLDQLKAAVGGSGKIKFKGKKVYGLPWQVADFYFLETCLKDGAKAYRSGTWSLSDGSATGDFSEEDVEFVGDGTLRIRLPEALLTAAVPEDAAQKAFTIDLKIFASKGPYMGEADHPDGWKQLIAVRAGEKGAKTHSSTINDVMAHELGHTMNQVVDNVPPGLTAGDHGRKYTGNEHQGSHCADGMDSADYNGGAGAGDYAGDFAGASECKCIMYGENDPKKSMSNGKYCDRCKKFIKAEKLDTLH